VLRSVKYGLNGAVLAGLIAVPALWNTVDKRVQLVVDGQPRAIETTAQSVGQVLHAAGFGVSAHDLLAPTQSSPVHDGTRIVLRRGRLLQLNVDGHATSVWTTAPTVAEALSELGYSSTDFVSVSRARRLPLGVTDIAIRTPRTVTVIRNGKPEQVSTTDTTVGQMLTDLGIDLSSAYRLSVKPSASIVAGQTVRVQRVDRKLVTRMTSLPYHVSRHYTATLSAGTTKVLARGKSGQARVTYALVFLDGRMVARTKVSSVVVAAPRTQVLKIGTRDSTPTTTALNAPSQPAPSPGTAKAIARALLADRGWGDTQYDCLVTLWNHESSWNVHAANASGAYGIPQALPGYKMSSAGPDWQNNATTQIKWGLGYIASRYNTPCGAWSLWQQQGWY
jgi:uncharacterized protein YabE (DUF348 family)